MWAARYADNEAVLTATGFGTLKSTHCTFSPRVTGYQKRAYRQAANLMAAAGLPVKMQFGEFLWWFFDNFDASTNPDGGMGYYDADTLAAAQSALGRDLHVFRNPDDSPSINGGADAGFLRDRLDAHMVSIRDHVRVGHPSAQFELLFAFDVNHDEPVGAFNLGGR